MPSKPVNPLAAVGCVLVIGTAWQFLSPESTRASMPVELGPAAAVSSGSGPGTHTSSDDELVGVLAFTSERERATRPATKDEATVPSGESDRPRKGWTGSMELVVEMPTKGTEEGLPVRVVLDRPQGHSAPKDWMEEAPVPMPEGKVMLEDLPPATSFRLQVFLGEERYAVTEVGTRSGQRTTLELDFATSEEQESGAISCLRSIAAAQQQLQASAAIDTDADGGGEHGYFAELAGTMPVREYSANGPIVDPNGPRLDPTYLPASMGELEPALAGGVMVREGYAFLIYLPDDSSTSPIGGLPEAVEGGSGTTLPGSSNTEIMWCCYAWPLEATNPMKKAFMINQAGDVIETANRAGNAYLGFGSAPAFDAAFSVPGDMGSEPGIATLGLLSTDRRVWSFVGHN